jgi:hypothetical protein
MMEPETDYRVEVSGWDAAESFFVEKATLGFSDEGERVIYLRHPVSSGSMLFLRLIDARVGYPSFPIAYKVKDVLANAHDEMSRVYLLKLEHRRPNGHPAHGPAGAAEPF